jgi:hypothetical protein
MRDFSPHGAGLGLRRELNPDLKPSLADAIDFYPVWAPTVKRIATVVPR